MLYISITMFIFATMVCKSISCQFLNTDVVNSISRLTLQGSSRPSSFSKMSPAGLLHFSTSSPNLHRYLEALSMLRRLWSEIVLWFVFVRVLSRGTYKHFIGYCSCFGATMYGTAGSSSSRSLVCFFLEVPVRHSTLFGTTVTDSLSDLSMWRWNSIFICARCARGRDFCGRTKPLDRFLLLYDASDEYYLHR